jgi:hypothetical protein
VEGGGRRRKKKNEDPKKGESNTEREDEGKQNSNGNGRDIMRNTAVSFHKNTHDMFFNDVESTTSINSTATSNS